MRDASSIANMTLWIAIMPKHGAYAKIGYATVVLLSWCCSLVCTLAAAEPPEKSARADNSLGMKLVWCPPGEFMMGSPASDEEAYDDEKPQVAVQLSRGFWLGQTEVTQGQWTAVMGTSPWSDQDYVREGAAYAATYVSWEDAVAFCTRLTDLERRAGRIGPGESYELPTEAQWEYACRAGSTSRYSFGDDASRLGDYAWWGIRIGDDNEGTERYAHEVGQKKPNVWKLYDMHGNVWEWCQDTYDDKLRGGRDPVDVSGSDRVFRGGSWNNQAKHVRSACRPGAPSDGRSFVLGLRVTLIPSQP